MRDEGSADDVPVEGEDERTVGAVFEALAHPRRRAVARAAQSADSGRHRFEELVDAAAQVTVRGGRQTPVDRQAVAVSLAHVHLPKLEDAGVIEETADGYRYVGGERVRCLLDVMESSDATTEFL